MICAGVARNISSDLLFFRNGDTLNADRYQNEVLAPILIPLCRQHQQIFQLLCSLPYRHQSHQVPEIR